MTKPIKPSEVAGRRAETIPPEVIDAFNEAIVANWTGRSATVIQKEVAAMIASKLSCPLEMVYDKHYLDVESIFEAAGWTVKYDKPGYCETYDAYFEFSKGKE